jgi:ribonuclease P protein component
MITKRNRFHGRNSLNGVYRHGKILRGNSITVRCGNFRRGDYRLAVVVSRKVSKSAVVRNRIRRRIYEIVRLHMKDTAPTRPHDMIITVFDESFASAEAHELRSRIGRLIEKIPS